MTVIQFPASKRPLDVGTDPALSLMQGLILTLAVRRDDERLSPREILAGIAEYLGSDPTHSEATELMGDLLAAANRVRG